MKRFAAILAGLAILGSACGGGDDDRADTIQATPAPPTAHSTQPATTAPTSPVGTSAPVPAPSATVQSTASTPTQSRGAGDPARGLLVLADMPTGWTASTPSANNDDGPKLCDVPPPNPRPARADAEFERSSLQQIRHIVTAYQPGSGRADYERITGALSKCTEWKWSDSSGSYTAKVSPLSFPKLGEQTFAYRVAITAPGAVASVDVVYIRVGDVISAVEHYAFGLVSATVDSAVTEQVARKAEAKIILVRQ